MKEYLLFVAGYVMAFITGVVFRKEGKKDFGPGPLNAWLTIIHNRLQAGKHTEAKRAIKELKKAIDYFELERLRQPETWQKHFSEENLFAPDKLEKLARRNFGMQETVEFSVKPKAAPELFEVLNEKDCRPCIFKSEIEGCTWRYGKELGTIEIIKPTIHPSNTQP